MCLCLQTPSTVTEEMCLENALFLLITVLSASRPTLSLMGLQNTSVEHYYFVLPLDW